MEEVEYKCNCKEPQDWDCDECKKQLNNLIK